MRGISARLRQYYENFFKTLMRAIIVLIKQLIRNLSPALFYIIMAKMKLVTYAQLVISEANILSLFEIAIYISSCVNKKCHNDNIIAIIRNRRNRIEQK